MGRRIFRQPGFVVFKGAFLMPITALYASFLAPLFIALSVRVILMRRSARVAVGDGGDKELLRRMRVHGNFAEYVPFILLLMGLAEGLGLDAKLLHAAGLTLLSGRTTHAIGVSQRSENIRLRVFAMTVTFSVMAALAVACVYLSLRRGVGA
jgi:uncharacterized membrane protein YecN with MAPEG domain